LGELRLENSKSAKQSGQQAQRLFNLAFRYGYADNQVMGLSKASSGKKNSSKLAG